MRILFRELPDNRIGWSNRLMIGTGMRTQEILALEPRHIAADGSSITIAQAVVRMKGMVEIGTPKSNDNYRTIPVPGFVQYCAKTVQSIVGHADIDMTFYYVHAQEPQRQEAVQ